MPKGYLIHLAVYFDDYSEIQELFLPFGRLA